jgi:hypothetical protein
VVQKKVLSKDSTLYAGARGSVVITSLCPGHVLLTLFGYNDGEFADEYYEAMNAMVARDGFIVVYMDSREQTGISVPERERATRWSKDLGPRYHGGHLLFRSQLLKMAVALANLVLGGKVKSYSSVDAFEHVISRNVPGFLRLPDFKSAAMSAVKRA